MGARSPFRRILAVAAMGAIGALAACEGTTAPEDADLLTDEDAGALADFLSGVDHLAAALAGSTGTRSFNKSVACPAGGTTSIASSSESSTDDATRIVSTRWTTTKTQAACAVTHTRDGKSVTAVMDGAVTTAGTSSYQLPAKRGEARTLLTWASATTGSTTTKVGDRTNTCAVDLKESYDPATKVFTVTGTMCGREVNLTRKLGG